MGVFTLGIASATASPVARKPRESNAAAGRARLAKRRVPFGKRCTMNCDQCCFPAWCR